MDRKDKNSKKDMNTGGSRGPSGAPAFNPSAPVFKPGASTTRENITWGIAGPRRVATDASSGNQGTASSSSRTISGFGSGIQGYTAVPTRATAGSGRGSPWGISGSGVSTAGTDRGNQVATLGSSRVATGASDSNLPTTLGSSRAASGASGENYVANAFPSRAPPNAGPRFQVPISGSNRPAANVGRGGAVVTPDFSGKTTNVWGTNHGAIPGPSGKVACPEKGTPGGAAGNKSQADPVPRLPSPPGWSKPTGSSEVRATEDAVVKKVSASGQVDIQRLQLGDKTHMPARRPDYGGDRNSKTVSMWANYFELRAKPGLVLYQYKIIIEPVQSAQNKDRKVIPPKGKKLKEIIKIMLQLPQFKTFQFDMVTDFGEILISRKELDVSTMNTKEPFQYQAEDKDDSRGGGWPERGATRYNVTLNEAESSSSLQVSDLIRFLRSTELKQTYGNKTSMVQTLDIILGQQRKSAPNLVTLGRGRCFPKHPNSNEMAELGDGLIALRGFFSSVRVATSRILVNCNICHGAFYPAIPLVDLFNRFRIRNNSTDHQKMEFERLIQGLQVEANHLPKLTTNLTKEHLPRVYRIFGLARPVEKQQPLLVKYFGAGPDLVKFHRKNADKSTTLITIASYWQDQNYTAIADVTLPVVNIGDQKKPRYLPPHVCMVIAGQMSRTQLLGSQTTSMIKFAKRDPDSSRKIIKQDSFGPLGLKANTTLDRFGIAVNPEMVSVTGRVLQRPQITYLHNKLALPNEQARWDLRDGKLLHSGEPFSNWSILRIARDRSEMTSENDFGNIISKFMHTLGKTIGRSLVKPPNDSWEKLISGWNDLQLKQLFSECQKAETALLVVVLPSKDPALYNQIKKLGDCEYGIQTVCVFWEMFYKGAVQYCANVALKINLKLGGINHILKDQLPNVISQGKTMVIGIDVTHPTGAKSTAPSVAAMVASADNELGQWPTDLRINTAKKEMVDLLGPMLETRLDYWSKLHDDVLPENLLIYRDGVSEGQYQTVLADELEKLRDACKQKYKERYQAGIMPRITLIIVGKRHHTRFYQMGPDRPDHSINPFSGTLVDRGITEARNWDFFLQSHHALQGTARPAHYFVLLNEIFSKANGTVPANGKVADVVETLTFNMCYLFGRATTAVSIPPPVFYADLACERGRRLLGRDGDDGRSQTTSTGGERERVVESIEIHDNVKDKMFYI